jgi:hypothetical protein
MDRLNPFRDSGRLRIKVYLGNGEYFNLYLYDLAMACYMGRVKPETFIGDMQAYYEWKSRRGLTVDHADNHLRNNTRLNLSLMTGRENRRKGSIAGRIQKPSIVASCYVDGCYRVLRNQPITNTSPVAQLIRQRFGDAISTGMNITDITMWFLCKDAEAYVTCLNNVVDGNIYAANEEIIKPMRKDGKWVNTGNGYSLDDVKMSIKMQEAIARYDISNFDVYEYCTE